MLIIRRGKSEVRSRELEVGSWKREVGSGKSEAGRRKSEVGRRKSEVGRRKTEAGSRESGVGSRKLGERLTDESKNQNIIYMKKFKFEKLIIWQKSMDLGEDIDKLSNKFPSKEQFNLTSQIRRAVDSIALNISEGSIGQSKPEYRRFLGYSIRSLAEVVTCLHKANRRDYITQKEFDQYYEFSFNLMNMTIAFKSKI